MYSLSFFVPESHLETVKSAVFETGAGTIGSYKQCAWATLGTGQYLPDTHSQPYQGEVGQLERVAEYKVEMLVKDSCLKAAVQALIQAHPYEVPVYMVCRVADIPGAH